MTDDKSGILLAIVEDMNTAIIDYQVLVQQDMYKQMLRLMVSVFSCNL